MSPPLERLDEMKRLPFYEGATPRDTFGISLTFRIILVRSNFPTRIPSKSWRGRRLLAELRAGRGKFPFSNSPPRTDIIRTGCYSLILAPVFLFSFDYE